MSRTPPRSQTNTVTDPGRQSQPDSAGGRGEGGWRGGGGEIEGTLLDMYTHAPAKKEVGQPGEREHHRGRIDVGCARTGGGRKDGEEGRWSGGTEPPPAVSSMHVDTLAETENVSGETGHDVGCAQGLKPTRTVHDATPSSWGFPIAKVCGVCGVCVYVCVNMCVSEWQSVHMCL